MSKLTAGSKASVRHVFFLINFAGSVLFFFASVISILAVQTPGSFLGGLAFFVPAGAFATAEWIAWFRKRRTVERMLGWLCLALAAFAAFGVVANAAEATTRGRWPRGFGSFLSVGVLVAAYFVTCGIYRLRRRQAVVPALPNA